MDLLRYLSVFAALILGGGDAGGHGSHHDHVKVHVPEFVHHDHHTKVITIHHHHHKPKEKHYHHHHHHKPRVPYGHHYNKHHKKTHTKTHTSISGHGQGSHGFSKHHGHKSHTQKHHDPPSFSYDPNPVTFEDDTKSFAPIPPLIPQAPQVYGVQHTVKQVKVFDSLPGALPGKGPSHGYEVTEEGEQSDDDAFTAINSLSQTYPGTFSFVHNAGTEHEQSDGIAEFPVQTTFQASHDPFASAPHPTSYADTETFPTGQAFPFSSLAPDQGMSPEIPATGYDETVNVFPGEIATTALLSSDDALNENTPVSFTREAGIQESLKTGNVETVVY